MTYIEFFDKNATENICASLAKVPQRVVLIGDKRSTLEKSAARYSELFLSRGHTVEFVWRTINKNNLQNIVDELTKLTEKYEDCFFDLTGGEDLYLVAVGIIAERYKDRHIRMHRFNIVNGAIADCDQDGATIAESGSVEMSIRENIRVYGGDIVFDDIKKYGTHIWDMNEDFRRDIAAMWDVCRRDVRLWNAQIGVLETVCEASRSDDPLVAQASVPHIKHLLKSSKNKGKWLFVYQLFEELYHRGLLTAYDCNDDEIKVSFKNDQVRRCLTKSGLVLEMLIYMYALESRDASGNIVYNDAMNGVCIDWDGKIHTERNGYDTENEIDIMLMHGMVPVFVSCKNGDVDIDELYKLNSVAQRFGGRYAKKVLVANALESKSTFDEYFRQRADDMNITLVENVHRMDEEKLMAAVRNFRCQ